mgnify:CR=1 FL=1
MNKCVGKAVDWLICRGEIEEKDRELYAYALLNILNTLAPIFLALLIGLILHCTIRMVMMIIPFVMLRKFSGGYHMHSAFLCAICSFALLIACSILSSKLQIPEGNLLIAAGAGISLILLSPRENINKPLTEQDRRRCRYCVMGIVITLYALIVIFYLCGMEIALSCFGMGMAFTAVLQYPCLLEKMEKN